MPYVMLWILISSTGGLTSGSQEFPSREACEAAQAEMKALAVDMVDRGSKEGLPSVGYPVGIRCISKSNGKG
jgi:hypothetical protein